ncbi:MAG: hypothetical protein AB7L66_21005 [Gemmatimonadales bacterium]
MFIELTDHLRCAGDHPEQFLVLLPDAMAGRRVARGTLGCPICGRVVAVENGRADFGGEAPAPRATALTGAAVRAFLGIGGPGGYLALFGGAARIAGDLAALLPGVRFVLVNPPPDTEDSELASVLRGGRSPLKSRSMRGAIVGADHGADPTWVQAAVAAVLPGLRIVVEGPAAALPGVEILAETDGVWVGVVGPARQGAGSRSA